MPQQKQEPQVHISLTVKQFELVARLLNLQLDIEKAELLIAECGGRPTEEHAKRKAFVEATLAALPNGGQCPF